MSLAVAAPFVYLVQAVVRRWVNVPFNDDWDFYWIVKAQHDGRLDFGVFYAQHNEHRILWPNLVMFGLASISNWDIRVQLAFSLFVAALTFVLLALMIRHTMTGPDGTGRERGLRWWQFTAMFLTSVIVFAPTAVQNWLWGWQIEWFMSVAGIVLAVWALGSWRTAQPWKQVLVAVLGATLATFSLGGGLLVWVVGLPLFAFARRLWRWSLVWVAAAAIEIKLYYTDYFDMGGESPLHVILTQPVGLARYGAVYLTRVLMGPFDQHRSNVLALGLVLLLMVSVGYVLLRHRSQFVTLVPWLCIGLVATGSAVVTGAARLVYGYHQAFSSRYTTISLLFVVAILVISTKAAQLAWTPAPSDQADAPEPDADAEPAPAGAGVAVAVATAVPVKARPSVVTRTAQVVPALGILTMMLAYAQCHGAVMQDMDGFSSYQHRAQDCARTASSPADGCLLLLYPVQDMAWERLEFMRSIGWVVPRSR